MISLYWKVSNHSRNENGNEMRQTGKRKEKAKQQKKKKERMKGKLGPKRDKMTKDDFKQYFFSLSS